MQSITDEDPLILYGMDQFEGHLPELLQEEGKQGKYLVCSII